MLNRLNENTLLINDILYITFPFLDLKDLANCELVNKNFNKILKNPLMWQVMKDE